VLNIGTSGDILMELEKAYRSQQETLRRLFNVGGNDLIAEKRVRLDHIFRTAERKWIENVERLKGNRVKYLLLAEAPPWTETREVRYFYNTFSGSWVARIWHAFFPSEKLTPNIDSGLSRLADQGFLLVDSLPFGMKYSSAKRRTPSYRKLVLDCLPFLFRQIGNPKISWAAEVRVALAFKLNGLAIIDALPNGLVLANREVIKLTANQIASDGSGFTNSGKLRNIWNLQGRTKSEKD
jgi:hypothetical protein